MSLPELKIGINAGSLKALRAARVLRPLKLVSGIPSMSTVFFSSIFSPLMVCSIIRARCDMVKIHREGTYFKPAMISVLPSQLSRHHLSTFVWERLFPTPGKLLKIHLCCGEMGWERRLCAVARVMYHVWHTFMIEPSFCILCDETREWKLDNYVIAKGDWGF